MWIITLVSVACVIMGIIDAVIQPGYAIKSAIKLLLFLFIPIVYGYLSKEVFMKDLFSFQAKGLRFGFIVGGSIFILIIGGYFLLKDVFDFSAIGGSLEESVGVTIENFLWVSLYISFVNSLLEEFFFRGFAFLTLKKSSSRIGAYLFSSTAFALYHVAMMIGWFSIWLTLLTMIGLFVGGTIFNYFNEKYKTIYSSWLTHMCANFAINFVGFLLLK